MHTRCLAGSALQTSATSMFRHFQTFAPVEARDARRGVIGRAVAAAFALAAVASAGAQRPGSAAGWVRESWSIADGLPVNSINSLLQSRTGYIWAATFDGLVRFDGVRFTVFNSANTPGLPSDRIIGMMEARDSSIWVTTEQRYAARFRRGRFTPFDRTHGIDGAIGAIREDSAGTIWLGGEAGLSMVRGDSAVRVSPEVIRGANIVALERSAAGGMWAAGEKRGVFHIKAGAARHLRTGTALDTLVIIALLDDGAGHLWVSTRESAWQLSVDQDELHVVHWWPVVVQRYVYEPATRTALGYSPYGVVRFDGANVTPVQMQSHEFTNAAPIQLRGRDSLWVAMGRNLFLNGQVVYSLDDDNVAAGSRIFDVLFDREDGIWIATEGAGLLRLRRSLFRVYGAAEGLAARNAYSVAQDSTGGMWIGSTGYGLSRIPPGGGVVRNFTRLGNVRGAIGTLLVESRDRMLVGLIYGPPEQVMACELPVMTCVPERLPQSNGTVQWSGVFALHRRPDGTVVAGTSRQVLERVAGTWRVMAGWHFDVTARAFAEGKDGALWIGTNGSGVMRCRDGRCRAITTAQGLPSDLIRSLHIDADGWLWIGTEGRGLARLDARQWPGRDSAVAPAIVPITVADGLYDPVVHAIVDDGLGRLWFSSNRGIYWVTRAEMLAFADGKVKQVRSVAYTERDGLRNREANGGFQPAGLQARDGRLWFVTQEGAVSIDPKQVPREQVPPPVVIEQVSTRARALSADTTLLTLDATERDLEITFTALTFREPRNVRFRYRLDPYDADWVDAGSRRTAFYTRVPPGTYTFLVAASQGGDTWSERAAQVEVAVARRFDETNAAKLLLALVLLVIGFAIVRWRLQQARLREAELTALVQQRTAELQQNEQELARQNEKLAQLNQLRSRLFANLSHEFRTPLTLILGPLRSLLDGRHGTLGPTIREQAELMQRNGQRLLRLINQILDLARLQAGAVAITRQPLELVAFTRTVAQAFSPLADRQGIAVVFRSPLRALTVEADGEQLEKVVLNLLSNAVKFTGAGGIVDVTVTSDDGRAAITVRDTGVGISAADLPHIFERFYQVDSENTRKYDGTGIGLALVKELVDLHRGEVSVSSVPNEGTTFVVRLPIGAPLARAAGHTALAPETIDDILGLDATLPAGELPQEESADDRVTVLVVDDNADVRAYVRSILAPAFHVVEAADGQAGLLLAREALPDLIVADVMMPELDGLGLAASLKGDAMTDAIPVVLLTARAAAEDQIAGLEAGADAYLVKPFDPGVLTACVDNLLTQRRKLRERFRVGDAPPPESVPATPSPLDLRLRVLVQARLLEPDFSPETLATAAGLSYHQLYRSLRDELGSTPSKYIRTVRAECAADLLRRGDGNVTEVAYAVGFESLSYFRRAFKERFDCSPSEFLAADPR